ncbi:nuclear transport factor 2 family protein [Rhodococcus sp. ACS1]|uniref:nuclear transport factor 2 family protein n=1 Tax=Rhodococcus sp. ACS1 TaxID=2028570 RepID=UPI0015CEE410|nr:nuclear transport factor 2 family protein [Rhodococcus sp. ACS1]
MTALDYEEIRQLIARYSHALDFQDLETFANLFTPDGSFNSNAVRPGVAGTHTGSDELRAFAAASGTHAAGHTRHTSNSVLIEGDGVTARASSYCLITHDYGVPDKGTKGPFSGISRTGLYIDELVKLDDRWHFKSRTFRYDGDEEALSRSGKALPAGRSFGSYEVKLMS